MKKQNYILSMIGVMALALFIAGCSAPSTNTAANVSNKTNPNLPLSNANSTTASNANSGGSSGGATNSGSR